MKKKELLKRIPADLPDKNYADVFTICRTRVLMVILPEWEISNHYGTGVVHFTWNTGYLTYYPQTGAWTREGIGWLGMNACIYREGFGVSSMEAVASFTGGLGTLQYIEWKEREINIKKKDGALERKQIRIDRFMREITPPLPRDFAKKCQKMRGSKKKIQVTLFQMRKDEGVMERLFIVDDKITEFCRGLKKEMNMPWDRWYYGEFSHRYGQRQQFWDRKGGAAYGGRTIQNRYLFDNLDELPMENAKKSCLRIMSGKDDPGTLILSMERFPGIEMVIKAGLQRLAREIQSYFTQSKIERIHKLPKNQLDRIKRYNGGMAALRMIELFPRITDENLKDFCTIRSEFKADRILRFVKEDELNINHLYTLWRKTGGVKMGTLQRYSDYLEMARQRGSDIHEEIIYRNKRWQEFHDAYVAERNRRREEEEKKKNKAKWEKWAAIARDYKRNRQIFEWEKAGYKIVVPDSAEAINEEGRLQHHCVGANDIYKTNMAIRKSFIVFLRRTEKEEEPYYTIETDGRRVIQAYAAYDRKPDAEIVQKILADWMKQVRKRMEEENGRTDNTECLAAVEG